LMTFLGRFDTYKGGVRIKLIIYQICMKTMSVKGGVYGYEAPEAKKKINIYIFLLCVYTGPTSFFYTSILLTTIHVIRTWYSMTNQKT
jgi:hypothetical protein